MLKKIAAGLGLGAGVSQVFAAVPTSVTDAITATQTDAVTVAGLMIGVTAALLVFKYIRRQMH